MNWKKIITLILIAAVIAWMAFQLKTNKDTAVEHVYHYNPGEPTGVVADTIHPDSLSHTKNFTGIFEPVREGIVNAEMQGKITNIRVETGDRVNAGQTLIELDHAMLDLELRSIETEIKGLQQDLDRYTALVAADAIQGIKVEKTQLGMEKAAVQKSIVLEKLKKSTIKAPFSGTVTAKMVEEGAFAAPGVPLIQLTNIGQLKFTIQVSEQELSQFSLKKDYQITADILPQEQLTGRTIMIGAKANKAHQFPVQFLVTNPAGQPVKAGMFGKVSLPLMSDTTGISIPASALQSSGAKTGVFLIEQNKAMFHPVTTGTRYVDRIIVTDGLSPGDVLITGGFINLTDGSPVIIRQ